MILEKCIKHWFISYSILIALYMIIFGDMIVFYSYLFVIFMIAINKIFKLGA